MVYVYIPKSIVPDSHKNVRSKAEIDDKQELKRLEIIWIWTCSILPVLSHTYSYTVSNVESTAWVLFFVFVLFPRILGSQTEDLVLVVTP